MAHPDLPDTDMLYARLLQLAFPLVLSEGDTDLLQQCYAQLVERTIPPSPLQPRLRTSSHGSRSSRPSRGHVVYESGKQVCVCQTEVFITIFQSPHLIHVSIAVATTGHCIAHPETSGSSTYGRNSSRGADRSATATPPTHTHTPLPPPSSRTHQVSQRVTLIHTFIYSIQWIRPT